MTKEQLFKKYSIDKCHKEWDNQIDNWMSVEIYRIMHNGNLPPQDDMSVKWITEFLDKISDTDYGIELMKKRDDFGSLYLTAKRMVYRLSDEIINKQNKWAGSKVKCDLCGREWIAVFPIDCEKLECPNCRNISYYKMIED